MLERIKNPLFIAAVASLLYQLLSKYGVAPTFEQYQLVVDLITYTFIGVGVYNQFKPKGDSDDKTIHR